MVVVLSSISRNQIPWALENELFRAALRSRDARNTAKDPVGSIPGFDLEAEDPLSVRVLRYVEEQGEASVGDLVEALVRPRSTLKRLVKGMNKAGDLLTVGNGCGTRYRRPSLADMHCLDERERMALAIVERDGRVTQKKQRNEAELATRTAGRVLAGLVEAGVLIHDGPNGNASGYLAASEG